MTREQIEMILTAKEELQKHLDERVTKLAELSKESDALSLRQSSSTYSIRAEIYTSLALVCAVEVGMYKAMLAVENKF